MNIKKIAIFLMFVIILYYIYIYYINDIEHFDSLLVSSQIENTNNLLLGWNSGKIIPTFPTLSNIFKIDNSNIIYYNTNVININDNIIIDLLSINSNVYYYLYNSNTNIINLTITPSPRLGNIVNTIVIKLVPSIIYYFSYNNFANITTSNITSISSNNYILLNNTYNKINSDIIVNTSNLNSNTTIYICNTNKNMVNISTLDKTQTYPLIYNIWYSLNYNYIENLIDINIENTLTIKCPSLNQDTDILLYYIFNQKLSSNLTCYNIAPNKYLLNNATISSNNIIYNNDQPVYQECINLLGNDFITIPVLDNSFYKITLLFWFKLLDSQDNTRIIDFSFDGNSDNIILYILNNNICASVFLSQYIAKTFTISTTNLNDGNWHHIAWKIDIYGRWTFYLDSILINTSINVKPNNMIRKINYIGKSSNSINSNFIGSISDFRLYSRLLSDNEIASIFNTFTLNTHLYQISYGSVQKNINVIKKCYTPPIYNNYYITIPSDDVARTKIFNIPDPAPNVLKSIFIYINNQQLIYDTSQPVIIDTTLEFENIITINSIQYKLS
jgi:hypothetical protein